MRVLVVDDARMMRRVISDVVTRLGATVVGEAGDGGEAIRQAEKLRPDLITLDIEMPGPNGLEVLRHVMSHSPTRVILVSSRTTAGADVTLEGLSLGAIDFVPKPSSTSGLDQFAARLEDAVAAARLSRPVTAGTAPRRPAKSARPSGRLRRPQMIVVASSTGGPRALTEFLSGFSKAPSAPMLVVQHMPAHFTTRLAARLDDLVPFPVSEAEDREQVTAGKVLIAPGDRHLGYRNGRTRLLDSPPIGRLRPAADITFEEVSQEIGRRTLAVVLTGMGKDGLDGVSSIVSAGGQAIAQDGDSCAVDGMPRAVREAGLATAEGSPSHLAELIESAGQVAA